MNFFKSVFSDEPLPSDDSNSDNQIDDPNPDPEQEPDHSPRPNSGTGAWSFGGLITTLATKSESVIQNYRRDLEEFGSGLKKETAVIREVASRAVKELPASLEVGASVAQDSLETVGQAIDDIGSTVWKSTAEIISHGRDAILADDDVESDNLDSDNRETSSDKRLSSSGSDLRRYSRFEAQVRAIQSNLNTFLEEPEDFESFRSWKLGFVLDQKAEEVENLIRENGVIGEIYGEIVPGQVDSESFWARYFYRVHKLKEVEDARAKLVKRAISGEEEDLSWDFDDDDDDENVEKEEGIDMGLKVGSSGSAELEKQKQASCEVARDSDDVESVEIAARESVSSDSGDKVELKFDENGVPEGKTDGGDSCKESSDVSIVSSQPSMPEEEDLGWDEIEDIGSIDENKVDASGSSTNRADLHKRLSAAEEEEDLSWDIEDDEDSAIKS